METRSSLSRSLHTNRGLEKLEPYEGKLSCTVLRGEEGSNALDLPDRPSDLQQRDGRGVRAGNEIAKHFAGIKSALRPVLGLANLGHSVLGTQYRAQCTLKVHN